MIDLPRRSVTRFFIPLIDVLTLLFCIYLLMPMVKPADSDGGGPAMTMFALNATERAELDKLRKEKQDPSSLDQLSRQRQALLEELARLRQEKVESLQKRLAIRVLEMDDEGKLYYHDAGRLVNRRIEVTLTNVPELIRSQKDLAGKQELYFLVLYPRVASGIPRFPTRAQREEYDRWFEGVAHGYDIPIRSK